MKNLLYLSMLLFLFSCGNQNEQQTASNETIEEKTTAPKLELVWQTDSVFRTPEAALYDRERDVVYIANVDLNPWEKDGAGFISKMKLDGSVVELEWVSGLHAPKGMGVAGGSLFVNDIDQIVEIDIEKGEIVNRYTVEGEKPNVNDIAIGDDGTVYASGSGAEAVFQLKNGQITTVIEGDLGRPNGLWYESGKLLMLANNAHELRSIDLATKQSTLLVEDIGRGDGVVPAGQDDYFVSNWEGEVFYISPEMERIQLLDTREQGINAADIDYVIEQNLLLVPTFFDNRVVAYRLAR